MALKILRNEELWFELSGNRFHQNDMAMVATFVAQMIHNDDDESGLSTHEINANRYAFFALFEKFRFNRTKYLKQINNFLQPYHLEIVIDKNSNSEE